MTWKFLLSDCTTGWGNNHQHGYTLYYQHFSEDWLLKVRLLSFSIIQFVIIQLRPDRCNLLPRLRHRFDFKRLIVFTWGRLIHNVYLTSCWKITIRQSKRITHMTPLNVTPKDFILKYTKRAIAFCDTYPTLMNILMTTTSMTTGLFQNYWHVKVPTPLSCDWYWNTNNSSCTMLQHVECVSPIVQTWDWTISHHCPESCSSHFFHQRDIQVQVNKIWFHNIL